MEPSIQESFREDYLRMCSAKKRPKTTLRSKLGRVVNSRINSFEGTRAQMRSYLNNIPPAWLVDAIIKLFIIPPQTLECVFSCILGRLQAHLSVLGGVVLWPIGSMVEGLALRGASIDLFIERVSITDIMDIPTFFEKVSNHLHGSQLYTNVVSFGNGTAPLIMCKDAKTSVNIKIYFTERSSLNNTRFVFDLLSWDWRLRDLVLLIKIWATKLELIGGRGNMSNHCLVVLVLFYLQQRPYNIPSVSYFQSAAPTRMSHGVNYGYIVNRSHLAFNEYVTVTELLKGFFAFYSRFDFRRFILAPHIGQTIPISEFQSQEYRYPAYENQLFVIYLLDESPPPERLKVGNTFCVQDPFCLNLNIARSVYILNFTYFKKCLNHAHRICRDPKNRHEASFYESLLYDTIEEISRTLILDECKGYSYSTSQYDELTYLFTPTRGEMRVISSYAPATVSTEELFLRWSTHYVSTIVEIIQTVYLIKMWPIDVLKKKSERDEHDMRRIHKWLLVANVDMWTSRTHVHATERGFLQTQLQQTISFQKFRRNNPNYDVDLKGYLTVTVCSNNKAIEISLTEAVKTPLGLNKKSALKKWFDRFKSSIQNYSLEEQVQSTNSGVRKRFLLFT